MALSFEKKGIIEVLYGKIMNSLPACATNLRSSPLLGSAAYAHLYFSIPHFPILSQFSFFRPSGQSCQQQSSKSLQQQYLSFSPVATDPSGHPSLGLVGMDFSFAA